MGSQQSFTAEQLKLLMDSAAGWADGWDDVLWYLQGPASADTHLPPAAVDAVREAVLAAIDARVGYSGDYRRLWEACTGVPAEDLPGPEIRSSPTDPIELTEDFLRGLPFPAGREDVRCFAEARQAPWRVLKTLDELPSRPYTSMDDLLDAVGDIAWNPRRETADSR